MGIRQLLFSEMSQEIIMINNTIFQLVYDQLVVFAPDEWTKMVVYLEYGNASYSFTVYYKVNNRYINCFDVDGANESEIYKAFKKIDKAVSKDRKKEKDPWSNMTITIESSGKMNADFDYTDLSKGLYQYKKMWKQKYLK